MEIPDEIAVMTLPGATLFPQTLMPLYIFEPRYRRMLADALNSHRMFSVAMQRPEQSREVPCPVAGLGVVRASVSARDGTSRLILQGLARVRLAETIRYRPYRVHRIEPVRATLADAVELDALACKIRELAAHRMQLGLQAFPVIAKLASKTDQAAADAATAHTLENFRRTLEREENPVQLADLVAGALLGRSADRQSILQTAGLEERLRLLVHFLMAEIERAGTH